MNPQFFISPLDSHGSKGAEIWHPAPLWMLKGEEDFSFPSKGRNWVWLHRRHLQNLCPKYWVIPPEIVKVPYSEERCETTHSKLGSSRGVKILLGFNLQSLIRLHLSLTHPEFTVKCQEVFFRYWKAVLCVFGGKKKAWIILRMEHGKSLIFQMYLYRVLSYFAKEEP